MRSCRREGSSAGGRGGIAEEREAHPRILETILRRQLQPLQLVEGTVAPTATERDDLESSTDGVGLESCQRVAFGRHEEESRLVRTRRLEVEVGEEVGDGGEGVEGGLAVKGDVTAAEERESARTGELE